MARETVMPTIEEQFVGEWITDNASDSDSWDDKKYTGRLSLERLEKCISMVPEKLDGFELRKFFVLKFITAEKEMPHYTSGSAKKLSRSEKSDLGYFDRDEMDNE